ISVCVEPGKKRQAARPSSDEAAQEEVALHVSRRSHRTGKGRPCCLCFAGCKQQSYTGLGFKPGEVGVQKLAAANQGEPVGNQRYLILHKAGKKTVRQLRRIKGKPGDYFKFFAVTQSDSTAQ